MSHDFDNMYGSRYFSVADLHGEQIKRRIGKVEVSELKEKSGATKRRYVVFFQNENKPLVLNKTNATKLATQYGKDPAKWIGIICELYQEDTSMGPGVRLRLINAAGTGNADLNDAIVF